jgi:hypothetical protein
MKKLSSLFALVAAATLAVPAFGQLETPRASPQASLQQKVGVTDVTINFSRPGVKGRQIWGELVPWDRMWRTGANEATTIEFSHDVRIEGMPVPAGKYALYTIPRADRWTLVLNSRWNVAGTMNYDQGLDVLRVELTPRTGQPHQEWLNFSVPDLADDSATIELAWKEMRVPFRVEVDTPEIVLENARETVAAMTDWRTPYRAALFAFEQEIVNPEVIGWVDHSIALNETWANLALRARLLAASGERAAAIAAAEKAIRVGRALERPADTSALEAELASWR